MIGFCFLVVGIIVMLSSVYVSHKTGDILLSLLIIAIGTVIVIFSVQYLPLNEVEQYCKDKGGIIDTMDYINICSIEEGDEYITYIIINTGDNLALSKFATNDVLKGVDVE